MLPAVHPRQPQGLSCPPPGQVGKGLAKSVQQGVGVLVNKAKDAASAAARSVGLDSGRGPEMSNNSALHDHGAAGKMEHAPPGESGWNRWVLGRCRQRC
jgi:hypothetical protein